MIRNKVISIILALILLLGLGPALDAPVWANSSAPAPANSDMDALGALGIDSGAAPEGFDPLSTENPFGKSIVELSPVYELYTVGLTNGTVYDAQYNIAGTTLKNGNIGTHSTSTSNILRTTLYGNEKWNKSVAAIMGEGAGHNAASGTTTATGDYTQISDTSGMSPPPQAGANNIPAKGYLTKATGASTNLGGGFNYALSTVAAGNFNGNKNGLSAQTVMVYTSALSSNGGLYLRLGDAKSGDYAAAAKELLSTSKQIGNPDLQSDGKPAEDFASAPYQLQNYLQVATGDWNGDGLDEIAVYIPEVGNSRIVVYALQLTDSDDKATAYKDPDKWRVVWTYALREGAVVSNMVSLVSGDVNRDGIDDLAATWGYYYGPQQNVGSTAVVMFGAKGTNMLKSSQQFNLAFGTSNIVRATFAFGDMAGSSASGEASDVLILCGQSDADLKKDNTSSRYVALFDWNGSEFTSNVYQNFDLFAKEDGKYIWTIMADRGDKFYSLPLCTANAAVIARGIADGDGDGGEAGQQEASVGGGDLLYFDSLVIEYTEEGLKIKAAWDNQRVMQSNIGSPVDYVEYGAVAGDLTGEKGAGTLFTMTQTLSSMALKTASYTVSGERTVPNYEWRYYYPNIFYRLFDVKVWYLVQNGTRIETTADAVNVDYYQQTLGKTYMVAVDDMDSSTGYKDRTQADFSTAICLANTDKDSSYMSYGGTHYYTYTDPEVLAVLASPPYFSDLVGRDDLSGNYAESTTSYSKSSGSGGGFNVSTTLSIGAYVSYEQDVEVFGVKVASFEAEAVIKSNFTFEMEMASTLEQTITYSAASGEDMVAFYSIPMEIYEYISYVPDGLGNYKEVLTTVNIPHEAAIKLISLQEYESIAKDYRVLPTIAANALVHTLGDPSSYPSSTKGYDIVAEYDGTPAAVGFSSAPGGSGIAQEIAMSKETNTAFSVSAGVEAKAGAGAGGFKVGYIVGAEAGAGLVLISTEGSSFSGELQNMPSEAQAYGYGMNWKIFCYKYKSGKTAFPVVSYIVSDVSKPAPLPDDFVQDMSETTDNSITLNWSYDKIVAGFQLYRYYEFPDGSGSYELAFVPFSKAVDYDPASGIYTFSYTDENLSPYTEYLYQIQTVRATLPGRSIYSEPMSCRTKTNTGYPTISLSGLNQDGYLPLYPDANAKVTAQVADAAKYKGNLSYQWQKLVNGTWKDISGRTEATLTLSNAGTADNTSYRCRINVIYYDENTATNYYISAYSPEAVTAFSRRSPVITLTAQETNTGLVRGLTANIDLYSGNKDHSAAPTGNITYTVTGTDYKYSEAVPLAVSSTTKLLGGEQKYYSTAPLNLSGLPDGVYTVTAYYSGSRVFKDLETAKGEPVVVGNASAYSLSLLTEEEGSSVSKFEYSDEIWPSLVQIGKNENNAVIITPITGAAYQITAANTAADFEAGDPAPNIGSYTMQALIGGNVVATKDFTVVRKPITVYIEDEDNINAGAVVIPKIACPELTAPQLAALYLEYQVTNSAGNAVILDNDTEPGNYSVTAHPGNNTPAGLYNNFDIAYLSGSYTIIGATFELKIEAADYTDPSGTRSVGKAGISTAPGSLAYYAAGTDVVLYAEPEAGYQVDKWTVEFKDTAQTKLYQNGKASYNLQTQACKVEITVTFKPAEIRLSTVVQPGVGGSISCDDANFSSGAFVSYGAEYVFTATPAEGYHFSNWRTNSGPTTATPEGTAESDGSNSLGITIGKDSMTVFAVFTRDSYTLTLGGDIEAYYMYIDNDTTKPPVKRMVASGASVEGDTEITVTPKTGYQAAEGACFIVNQTPTTDDESHTFIITENTTVSLATVRNSYGVEVTAENGTVGVTVNGNAADAADLESVDGGSALVFKAHAQRGYIFDKWMLNGVEVANSTHTLTISALGSHTQISALFEENEPYTLSAAVSDNKRGAMRYSLYDIYGDLIGTENTAMPEDGLTVYRGESVILSVLVESGSMVEQWVVNGDSAYDTKKTYSIEDIGEEISAVVYLKASSRYSVYFDKINDNGALTAKADGLNIESSGLQFGGSTLEFRAQPETTYMVDYWTVTQGDLIATESENKLLDEDGHAIVHPIHIIDPLKQNLAVGVKFKALVNHRITLPGSTEMGDSAIIYVTPILPTDDGIRSLAAEDVRDGGTVKMTFEAKNNFGTSAAQLEALLADAANEEATITVNQKDGIYTATVAGLQQGFTLLDADIFNAAYTVTVPSHVEASPSLAVQGATVNLTVTPAAGYRLSGLTINNDDDDTDIAFSPAYSYNILSYTFEMPAANVTVNASFESVPDNNNGGGGGGGGGAPAGNQQGAPVSLGGTQLEIPATLNNGIVYLEMDKNTLNSLKSAAGLIEINLSAFEGATGVVIPAGAFGALTGANTTGLDITFPDVGLRFDNGALQAVGAAGSGAMTLTAKLIPSDGLSDEQKAIVGNRPVLDLNLTIGGKRVSDFGSGNVDVNLPYTLGPGENPDSVVVWHLNNKGILEAVEGRYDESTGCVVFITDHFSRYIVGLLPFEDVSQDSWYFECVSFAYANGLFSGIGDAQFGAGSAMTRSMLVTVLWRLEGKPAATAANTFSDVMPGQWYTEAIAWAAENGIVNGYGSLFGTNDSITREQMATILLNYAKYKGYDAKKGAALNNYTDAASVSPWAEASMKWAVAEGLITGITEKTLVPGGNTSRAQVAMILMRFIESIVK